MWDSDTDIVFDDLRYLCKYCHDGFDIEHHFVSTCRHPDNTPHGMSWGICSYDVCPYLKKKQQQGGNKS